MICTVDAASMVEGQAINKDRKSGQDFEKEGEDSELDGPEPEEHNVYLSLRAL